MDVAVGAANVSVSGRRLSFRQKGFAAWLLCLALMGSSPAQAATESQPIHFSGDKEIWDRKTNRHELFGHAVVREPGETMMADYIILDHHARTLDAHGNCIYIASDSVIYGEEMHFNLDSRTGTIVAGRVSNDRFTLGGERINKLGEGRFQTHWGEYSTCRDCTQSWTLQAQDVDMQVEGYAYLSNVTVKVKDTPTVWLPYLIVPMKTRRQSGLLFPVFSVSQQNGFAFVQPFFWAINRSADMTFGLGEYSEKGLRVETEARYALSPRSGGKLNLFYLNDKTFVDENLNPSRNTSRWGLDVGQTQELPFGIEEKLRIRDVSDNYYPFFFNDMPNAGEKDLVSSLSFSHSSSDFSAYIVGKRARNLLDTNPDKNTGIRGFDPSTVQLLPGAEFATNDRLLLGLPLATGLTVGVSNFTRSAGPWDPDTLKLSGGSDIFRPGVDVLRQATRVSVTPSIYASLRPWDSFTFTPSVKYFGNFYSFHNVVDNWYQSYVLFQADLTTQLERLYSHSDPNQPRTKHLIRPLLQYSFIPPTHQDDHPFKNQIYDRTEDHSVVVGNYFDNQDIVPLNASPNSANYYLPLGNTLVYGFTTQLIDRYGKDQEGGNPLATYTTPLEWTVGHAINFREYSHASDSKLGPRPLTRVYSSLHANWLGILDSNTTYYYYPYAQGGRNQISTAASYVLERSVHQRILTFDRSVTLGYNYSRVDCTEPTCGSSSVTGSLNFSLSDYILPNARMTYDFKQSLVAESGFGLQFQSPSQCWKLNIGRSYNVATGSSWQMDASINLTGTGFGGASEAIGQATAPK